ncbi:hypothetical protein COHA_003889 [Chlorella ohadii]|uniref:Uncharacterized protein n=1 Tax=Chlorella ohadii TaxID=2649997 RepID=A0AAD5DTS8_9CHLO|nr:hypothetical protein COHA_003889 [Chlorella ohadii]
MASVPQLLDALAAQLPTVARSPQAAMQAVEAAQQLDVLVDSYHHSGNQSRLEGQLVAVADSVTALEAAASRALASGTAPRWMGVQVNAGCLALASCAQLALGIQQLPAASAFKIGAGCALVFGAGTALIAQPLLAAVGQLDGNAAPAERVLIMSDAQLAAIAVCLAGLLHPSKQPAAAAAFASSTAKPAALLRWLLLTARTMAAVRDSFASDTRRRLAIDFVHVVNQLLWSGTQEKHRQQLAADAQLQQAIAEVLTTLCPQAVAATLRANIAAGRPLGSRSASQLGALASSLMHPCLAPAVRQCQLANGSTAALQAAADVIQMLPLPGSAQTAQLDGGTAELLHGYAVQLLVGSLSGLLSEEIQARGGGQLTTNYVPVDVSVEPAVRAVTAAAAARAGSSREATAAAVEPGGSSGKAAAAAAAAGPGDNSCSSRVAAEPGSGGSIMEAAAEPGSGGSIMEAAAAPGSSLEKHWPALWQLVALVPRLTATVQALADEVTAQATAARLTNLQSTCGNLAVALQLLGSLQGQPATAAQLTSWAVAAAAGLRLQPALLQLHDSCRSLGQPSNSNSAVHAGPRQLACALTRIALHSLPECDWISSEPVPPDSIAEQRSLATALWQLHSTFARLCHWTLSQGSPRLLSVVQLSQRELYSHLLDWLISLYKETSGLLQALSAAHAEVLARLAEAECAAAAAESPDLAEPLVSTPAFLESLPHIALVVGGALTPALGAAVEAAVAPLQQDSAERARLADNLHLVLQAAHQSAFLAVIVASGSLLGLLLQAALDLADLADGGSQQASALLDGWEALLSELVATGVEAADRCAAVSPSDSLVPELRQAADRLSQQQQLVVAGVPPSASVAERAAKLRQLRQPAAHLARLICQWRQQREPSRMMLLALGRAAAARSCAYLRCANVAVQGGPSAGQGVGSARCR